VYRWTDADGVVHLSSVKPPAGVAYERRMLTATSATTPRTARTASSSTRTAAAATGAPSAGRTQMIAQLQNRECVVALETMDRLARGGQAVEPREFQRLQQTADRTCSRDPAERRAQEEMAARLRVANGDTCVDARNALADMLAPGRRPSREQLKTQQEFIEAHCKAPVR
jgi:hypothetical protein